MLQVTIKPASLVLDPNATATDAVTVGVAAIQQVDGRRLVQEGAVAIIINMQDGRRVDVVCDPSTAQHLGCLLTASSFVAANALPPILNTEAAREVVAATAAPRIITPGRH